MDTIAADLDTLRDQLGELLAVLSLDAARTPETEQLLAAYGQLFEVMERLDRDRQHARAEQVEQLPIDELGDYAFDLLDETHRHLPMPTQYAEPLALLKLGCAEWVARHGGHIDRLDTLVDSAALLANRSSDAAFLARLAEVLLAITDAAADDYKQDLDAINPGRPWRLLHINLGIVATRSTRADLMEQAFSRLTRHLPQDAAQFFHQGMEQLKQLNFPEPVRSVMTKYYATWGNKPALH